MHIYQSHLGGIYTSEYNLPYENLYCEQCGDSDTYIGYATNRKEARNLLKNYYNDDYAYYRNEIREFLDENFEKGTYKYIELFKYKYICIIQDDDEYVILPLDEDEEEYFCFSSKKEAINKANEYEKEVKNITQNLFLNIKPNIKTISSKHNKDETLAIVNGVLQELSQDIISYIYNEAYPETKE